MGTGSITELCCARRENLLWSSPALPGEQHRLPGYQQQGRGLGVAVFGNEHSHECGVCTAWAPHVPAGDREAVTSLYQEKREHCQHGQWVSSANTAQVKLN